MARRNVTRLKPLVGGKAVISAKRTIETAIRRDFARQVRMLARDAVNMADFTPKIREHAFAKRPGEKPIGASLLKYPYGVAGRKLNPGEKFAIHTHPNCSAATQPSIRDLQNLVKTAQGGKKITQVISVIETSGVDSKLFNEVYHSYLLPHSSLRRLHPSDRHDLKELVSLATRQLSSEIREIGRVFMQPTQALLQMPPQKREKLLAYLNKMLEVSGSQRSLTLQTKKYISRTYGKLFKVRYVPMPGYKYSERGREFAKT
ncbi:MAG: hypothetical protein NTW59_00675 [Candidatus Diapherotrites archaeon]|nr:hypothetical protein [Candidatus Diapherotrites archaeon]